MALNNIMNIQDLFLNLRFPQSTSTLDCMVCLVIKFHCVVERVKKVSVVVVRADSEVSLMCLLHGPFRNKTVV